MNDHHLIDHLYRRLTDALTELDNHLEDPTTPRFTTYRKDHQEKL